MALSVVEKVLGTVNPYSTNYLDATMRLTKSFTIHHPTEAKGYNDFVVLKYKKVPNMYNRKTWRYYKHLAGEYHEVDVPMVVISRDSRKEITLTKETLEVHIETREALTQFGEFYDEVVAKYPEQELLLKTLIANNDPMPIDEIIKLKKWQIVSYNNDLVEPQETNLILSLQERIDKYAIRGLIDTYSVADNLFLAVLYCQLYNFIYLNLLSLRLKNLKTNRVHSYHLLNYFASHHGLDTSYDYIDDYQRMYLYRNLKYLDAHAGSENVFKKMVKEFFDRKRVLITNYEYKQLNELREDRRTNYGYKQRLRNNINFVYEDKIFTPEELAQKEILIAKNNKKEYDFNFKEIDFKMLNSLAGDVKTKDLEILITDTSNDVRYKLINTLFDYWSVTIELGYNTAIVNTLEPITGKELLLDAKDAYKLFCLCILRHYELNPIYIPDVTIWWAYKEDIPDDNFLIKRLQNPWPFVNKIVSRHAVQAPRYRPLETRFMFRQFVEKVYRFELGMWIYLVNTGNLYSRYDIQRGYEDLHRPYEIHNDEENVKDFLKRIQLEELDKFTPEQCLELAMLLMNKASDDVLEANEINRLTQEAVVNIFSKFKSYTTQFLNNFQIVDTIMLGLESPYYALKGSGESGDYFINLPPEVQCTTTGEGSSFKYNDGDSFKYGTGEGNCFDLDVMDNITTSVCDRDKYIIHGGDVCFGLDEELSTPDTVLTKELFIRLFDKEK